jgi:imidazolonepropionase-like amidohydrolase
MERIGPSLSSWSAARWTSVLLDHAGTRAGARSIEHGVFLDDEALELMLQTGAWLVPTLVAPVGVLEAAARGDRMPDQVLRLMRLDEKLGSLERGKLADVVVSDGEALDFTDLQDRISQVRKAGLCPAAPCFAVAD